MLLAARGVSQREYRHRDLPGLPWGRADHCLHRGSEGDREFLVHLDTKAAAAETSRRLGSPATDRRLIGFLQGFGILIGIGIPVAGFFVPWPTGVFFIGLGVIVVAVVAIATK